MGEGPKNLSSWMGFPLKHVSLVLVSLLPFRIVSEILKAGTDK